MSKTAVWAFKRLPALGNQVGIVHVEHDIAKQLLADGEVQDLRQGRALRRVEQSYGTKVMVSETVGEAKVVKPKSPKAKKNEPDPE